jgi:mono/diheme cytochrome c family protein
MKKWLKRLAIALGVIVLLIAIAAGGAYGASVHKQGATYDVPEAGFDIPSGEAALAEGERIYRSRGCRECHGENGAGRTFIDDPALGRLVASNLTILGAWEASDWDRAVRHGVASNGTSLIFMPSRDFELMPDAELGPLVAYIRSLPQVNESLPATSIGPVARAVDLAGGFILFPGSVIEHDETPPARPTAARSVEYGRGLARLCTGCHGEGFSGGPIPGAPPELGTPTNLTQHETGLRDWSEEDFRRALREGVAKDGHQIRRDQMPWPDLALMTDDEIGAIWMYLETVPPLPEGSR